MLEQKNARWIIIGVLLLLFPVFVSAQDLMATLNSVTNMLYGIAAGIAALMLALMALKWKTAEGPAERESAKKGMTIVVGALAIVIFAGTAAEIMKGRSYVNSQVNGEIVKISTTSELQTTRRISTTTRTTTKQGTSSTNAGDNSLTASNLVDRINAANGFLVSNVAGCQPCRNIRDNVFGKTSDGPAAFSRLRKWDPPGGHPACNGINSVPTWCSGTGNKLGAGCKTLSQLNVLYGLGLECKTGYTYYDCNGNPISCP